VQNPSLNHSPNLFVNFKPSVPKQSFKFLKFTIYAIHVLFIVLLAWNIKLNFDVGQLSLEVDELANSLSGSTSVFEEVRRVQTKLFLYQGKSVEGVVPISTHLDQILRSDVYQISISRIAFDDTSARLNLTATTAIDISRYINSYATADGISQILLESAQSMPDDSSYSATIVLVFD
jgi:hypothetical protein